LYAGVSVLVELLRRGDVGVAENQLCVTSRYADVFKQGGSGVPQVVNRNDPQAVASSRPLESANEIAWLDRMTVTRGEDQVVAAASGDRHCGSVLASACTATESSGKSR
jgi:uncharacterized protein YifE (UPF0438 family)